MRLPLPGFETLLGVGGVSKVCPICGAPFVDYSRSGCKETCSKSCRTQLWYQKLGHDGRKRDLFRQRLNVLRSKGVTISPDEERALWTRLFEVGRCEVCGASPGLGRNGLHIDHDHETGRVRGVLCKACNHSLPHNQTPEALRSLADYLEGSGAVRLSSGHNTTSSAQRNATTAAGHGYDNEFYTDHQRHGGPEWLT